MRSPNNSTFKTLLIGIRSNPSSWTDLAVFPVILVLSIPPLIWFGRYWQIYIDSAHYLLEGWKLISGGSVSTARGPVFTGLIGFLVLLLGRDTESLAWAVRLLALLNPLLAYFLVKRVSGPFAGLLAAALITLFSYTATITESFNIDTASLTVYLLALLTLLIAVQKKESLFLALLSGLLLGASILTKETLLTNLPLALIAALLVDWNVRGVIWHYLGVALVCAPWWTWVWFASGEVYLVGSLPSALRVPAVAAILVGLVLAAGLYISGMPARYLASARRRRWTAWLLGIAWIAFMSGLLLATSDNLAESSFGAAVKRYVVEQLAPNTPLWPLLLVAGGYMVWKAIRGNPLWQFLAAALFLQAPVWTLVAVEGFSLRQFLVPQALLLCALAVLVVEACNAAVRRRGAPGWLTTAVAALLVAFLLLSAAGQVRALLGDPSDWSSLDRTSRPSAARAKMVSAVVETHNWITENVPEGENILANQAYFNYQVFLDGGRHGWARLPVDCARGTTNPGKTGCVPSEAVAEAPPKPTVWFSMANDCRATALSMPTLLGRMEQMNSDYILVGGNSTSPGILAYLIDTGAFEVAHAQGLVLLKRTGETPEAAPTRMDANTVRNLVRCEAAQGPGYAKRIRTNFPNGIALEPFSNRGRVPGHEAQRNAKARAAIERIYRAGSNAGQRNSVE